MGVIHHSHGREVVGTPWDSTDFTLLAKTTRTGPKPSNQAIPISPPTSRVSRKQNGTIYEATAEERSSRRGITLG